MKEQTKQEDRQVRILRAALDTILFEAKEPIIKVYAQTALDLTKPVREMQPINSHCVKHRWFGLPEESCPICKPKI